MANFVFSQDVIHYIFDNDDDRYIVAALKELIEKNGNDFELTVAEAIVNAIEAKGEQSEVLSTWVASLEGYSSPLARFVYYKMRALAGNCTEAIEGISAIISSIANMEPFLLLYRARLLVRMKRMAEATHDIRTALSLYPSYSFFVKCEALIRKIIKSGEWVPRGNLKVALLGSSTTTFLAPVLQALCFKDGINALVYQGAYGNYQHEILNLTSGLYNFAPEIVVMIPNYRDVALPPRGTNKAVTDIASASHNLWMILQKNNPCHIIQVGFTIPPYGTWGTMEDSLADGRSRLIQNLNSMLLARMPNGVSFLDMNRVALQIGEKFYSDIEWYTAKQYPATEALPLLSTYLTAHFRAVLGISAKVLVLDLDNTLWGGVIGEDGVAGIVLGSPSPEGEGYLELHQYVKELKERGVLLAVCSKNNMQDAKLPFQEHDSMVLNVDDFVIFTANWQDKATNIKNMADTLSLGLDSFVFIDDNPLERSWVRARLPQVLVPECGNTPWEILNSLREGNFFETMVVTAEDTERHQNYKFNVERQKNEKTCESFEDFLIGLEMVAESGPLDDKTLTRVTQLVNKTNQFNLTTRRYSQEQVKWMAQSPDWWTRWFRLKDRFGDHGLIGVMLVKKNGKQWDVASWLMSCRVLGRRMEEFMSAEMLMAAKAEGAIKVCGQYIPTAKNALVKDMYSHIGFEQQGENTCYFLNLEATEISACQFIRGNKKTDVKPTFPETKERAALGF